MGGIRIAHFIRLLDGCCQWMKRFGTPPAERKASDKQQAEIRRFKAALKRVSEQRDIPKKAATYFAKVPG